ETVVSHLFTLRTAIESYRSQHHEFPGRDGAETFVSQLTAMTSENGQVGFGPNFPFGPYVNEGILPTNPITDTNDVRVVSSMPTEPSGGEAWIYDWTTGEIHANAPGETEAGTSYFDL
ncbi:MAG: hypothetical protein ACYTCU_01765, partial [Planctomycetota bacterium]